MKRFVLLLLLLLFIFLIGVGVYVGIKRYIKEQAKINLEKAVTTALAGIKGTYGIAIKNLKTNQTYYYNEHRVFDAGSLYKVWVMSSAFEQIEKGKLTEDEILHDDIAVLNDTFGIGSESAELTTGTITLSVRDTMRQMITISHNYAALLLSKRIKLSTVKTFLSQQHFNESSLGDPKTTPHDIALFFEKLYKGQLANPANTKKMFDLLKEQKLNDGLPKHLPKNIKVAHKTGDISWFKHDAGIVFTDKGDYIIVVMSESKSPTGAQERIAQVSKAVYEYFAH